MLRYSLALATLMFSTALAAPADPLEMSVTPFVRGYPATISLTGAAANKPVYLGYSNAGLNPGAICPPPLGGECLDLAAPALVPVQPRSNADGDADLTFTVPPFLSDMHMQAATLAPTAEVSPAVEVLVYDANPSDTLDNHINAITDADISLELDIQLDDSSTVCTLFGICSCVAEYSATGGTPVRSGQALTFTGDWLQTATTCNPILDTFIWTAGPGGQAYHTIYFGQHDTSLDLWVAHSNPADAFPVSDDIVDQYNASQFVVATDPLVPFLGYSDLNVVGVVDVDVDLLGFAVTATINADASITFGGLPAN